MLDTVLCFTVREFLVIQLVEVTIVAITIMTCLWVSDKLERRKQ